MAFDMGFDFRGTLAYVTDPSFCAFANAAAYPTTYTNGDGYSINAGVAAGFDLALNRDAAVDPRLAGALFQFDSAQTGTFQVDLSSGSAPGAGDYTIDLAIGTEPAGGAQQNIVVALKDDTVPVIAFGPVSTAAGGERIDATGTVVNPGTGSWDLVRQTVNVTFATTTCLLDIISATDQPQLNHFRLTLGGAVGWGPLLGGRRNRAILN